MMTENELRALISRSQKDGFNALFQQYKGYVYTIVWEKIVGVGTREDAEECVSDVFLDVFLHYENIYEGTMHGYIGTVARNKAINLFRKLTAKPAPAPLDDEKLQYIASGEQIESNHEKREMLELLLDMIRSFGEPDATILIMRYYYNYKSDEIAKAVHLNPVTVRVRLNRAVKRLRRRLPAEYFSKGGGRSGS